MQGSKIVKICRCLKWMVPNSFFLQNVPKNKKVNSVKQVNCCFNMAINIPYHLFQTWLIMTGKLPGPFDIAYFSLKDSYGNELALPKLTAITLLTSGLAIVKTCADLNIVRIHLQEGFKFPKFFGKALIYLPYFMTSIIFRLSAMALLMTYFSTWTILPVSITFMLNMKFGYTR